MLVWFAAGSVAIVWAVFQSPAIDYRMVMLGSVLGVAEAPFGLGPLHTLVVPVLALGVVMGATVGRRLVRRQLLGVPIGMFLFLVLDGSWTVPSVFWWPASGWDFGHRRSLIAGRGLWSILLELVGVGLAAWLWQRFGLADPGRRRRFLTTGQLDRSHVGSRR